MDPGSKDDRKTSTLSATEALGSTPRSAIALERGDALGRYIVVDRLGAGGMGVVYAAYDPDLDRKLAVKILRRPRGRIIPTWASP